MSEPELDKSAATGGLPGELSSPPEPHHAPEGVAAHDEPDAPAPAEAESRPDGAAVAPTQTRGSAWLVIFTLVVVVASLLLPLSHSGIWDPHELEVAEFGRRIALNLLGGSEDLSLEGAQNDVPIRRELGRGELPFTSVALGFRVLGLHDWAGRLPLALWGLVGVWATYCLVRRLSGRVAALTAAALLATTPAFFLHARTMLGDIVTMAGCALAVAGFGIACFMRPEPSNQPSARAWIGRSMWLLVGGLGLAAGFGARGALLGVAVPTLGVGVAWWIWKSALRPRREWFGDSLGVVLLLLGGVAAYVGHRALGQVAAEKIEYSIWLGASLAKKKDYLTFDVVLRYLGHGAFPLSAVVPLAFGRLFAPRPDASDGEQHRELGLRLTLLSVAAIAFAAYAYVAPVTGFLPYSALFALAGCVALALRGWEIGSAPARAFALGAAALAVLLYYDFQNFPEKAFAAYGLGQDTFPESFRHMAHGMLRVGTLVFCGVFVFSLFEHQRDDAPRFERREYVAWWRELRTQFGGNVWFFVLALEAGLVAFALATLLAPYVPFLRRFAAASSLMQRVAQYGWLVVPVAVVLLPWLSMATRDAFRTLFLPGPAGLNRWWPRLCSLRLPRMFAAALSIIAFGLVLSLAYYPALASQVSPKEVFVSYQRIAKPGDELGLLGVSASGARYYADGDVPLLHGVHRAYRWLREGENRRFVVVRAKDLPQLNSMFRRDTEPSRNLPVLDARSSEILLVSNRLLEGEQNQNPFEDGVLTHRPKPSHALDVMLDDKLRVLGWDVLTLDGQVAEHVRPGKPYRFVIYYAVEGQISGDWKTFVHIDGFQRRFNADHDTLDGKYPLNLWRRGDFIADRHVFQLEPNFTPGRYRVYFGLYRGDRRLPVTRGAQDENRVKAGDLIVR